MPTIDHDLAATLAVVVDEGTLDAAAKRLHITPSAVSQRIRTLENDLGRVLLVRSKPARATEAGAHVVRLARQSALAEREALTALGAGPDAVPGTATGTNRDTTDPDAENPAGSEAPPIWSIPLAVNADSLATWFLAPLARIATRHPVVFDLHRDDQDRTADLLAAGTVMAAVTSREKAVSGCRSAPLGAMRYIPVASPSYVARHLAARTGRDALDVLLERAPLVDFDRADDLQRRWLRERGLDPAAPPRSYVPASADFATAVRLGLGWALLPEAQARDDVASGALIRIDRSHIDVPLWWQQWNLRSVTLDAIAAEVAAEARSSLR